MIRRLLDKFLHVAQNRTQVAYDATFFTEAWFRNWAELQPVLWALIAAQPRWRAVLDYGCGAGAMVDPMNDEGYRYIGCDRSVEARTLYLRHFGRHPGRFLTDLSEALTEEFDLALAFDVFEHMADDEIRIFLQETQAIPEFFVNISRERGLPGHINIKSDKQWIALCESSGLSLDANTTDLLRRRYCELRPRRSDLWHKNLFVFSRTTGQ